MNINVGDSVRLTKIKALDPTKDRMRWDGHLVGNKGFVFEGALSTPIRVGERFLILSSGDYYLPSAVAKIIHRSNGLFIKTRNSTYKLEKI
jgi:hypothetical protein